MLTVSVFPHATPETRDIRARVFVEEQGFVTPQEEFDEYDEGGVHVLVQCDGVPAGTGRLIFEPEAAPGTGKLGRIAVLSAFRRTPARVGACILSSLEEEARRRGLTGLYVSAQCRAQGFYEHCGFVACGQPYDENGVPHIRMEKQL